MKKPTKCICWFFHPPFSVQLAIFLDVSHALFTNAVILELDDFHVAFANLASDHFILFFFQGLLLTLLEIFNIL